MIDICVEVDGVVLHIDLANALKLKLVQLRSIKIDTNDGASIQPLIVLFVALPLEDGDLHRKANESNCPFLVYEDDALALGDLRGHHGGD